jgi:hypothetical protein
MARESLPKSDVEGMRKRKKGKKEKRKKGKKEKEKGKRKKEKGKRKKEKGKRKRIIYLKVEIEDAWIEGSTHEDIVERISRHTMGLAK